MNEYGCRVCGGYWHTISEMLQCEHKGQQQMKQPSRKEQIEEAANRIYVSSFDLSARNAFIQGAQWADENPQRLEKLIEAGRRCVEIGRKLKSSGFTCALNDLEEAIKNCEPQITKRTE
jgi:hypothetical protein